MDAAKKRKLVEIGYEVRDTCDMCVHGSFMPGSLWGSCIENDYNHEKHTDDRMPLSIYVSGWCTNFTQDRVTDAMLGGFSEFRV